MHKNYENLTHAPTIAKAVAAEFVPVISYGDLAPGSWQREEADKGRPFYGPSRGETQRQLDIIRCDVESSEAIKREESEKRIAESLGASAMAEVYDLGAARQAA